MKWLLLSLGFVLQGEFLLAQEAPKAPDVPNAQEAPETPEAPKVQEVPENLNKLAFTDPTMADADFPFQGEYVGVVSGRPFGLQVVAQGGGQFIGTGYFGGLPGAGWNGDLKERFNYVGQKVENSVQLTVEGVVIDVLPESATLTLNGNKVGDLKKTHRKSVTLGLAPPDDAITLFDGTHTNYFPNGTISPEGFLMEGADFKRPYKNYRLHLEFRLPYMPYARGQGRSNSGVYLQSRYEVQILDSFGLEGLFNECGALYRYQVPRINMCLPPLSWQTYDIDFQAALFDYDGKKIRDARITVWLNGVKVHDAFDLERKTGAGKPEGAEPFPIRLQNHGNPVRFKNIWIIDYDSLIKPPVPLEAKIAPDPVITYNPPVILGAEPFLYAPSHSYVVPYLYAPFYSYTPPAIGFPPAPGFPPPYAYAAPHTYIPAYYYGH